MKTISARPRTTLLALVALLCPSLPLLALPDVFETVTFAAPPHITYPTSVAAAPTGEVYVSVDKNSSLDQQSHRGKIVRCVDTNGDGKADHFTDYVADIDSPRGSCFVHGTLYVINPPYLTAYRDTDADGIADEKKHLVTGLGFDLSFRGADHTSNGVRMGIDGWLYMAIGDYGFLEAKGTDGSTAHLHGGGVVRVRPDGSHLELFSLYTRNIYDVAISPTLDLFARDNTNDGKGWNTRLHQFVALGNHGYPRLYKNFPDEVIEPLADYGGGSGTGDLFLDEPGIPAAYNKQLYTCDYTTQGVYRHELKPVGDTYQAGQEKFFAIKAIDMDVDGQSRLFVCDWNGGGYRFDKPDVGSVTLIKAKGYQPSGFPDLHTADKTALISHLKSDSAVLRLNAQREILSRGPSGYFPNQLSSILKDDSLTIEVRVAALFTLKQLLGARANPVLASAINDSSLREHVLRAMADLPDALDRIDTSLFTRSLTDEDPRVRLQAVIGLSRLGAASSAPEILPLGLPTTESADGIPRQRLPHIAVKALVSLQATDACLAALSNPALREPALAALQEMHTSPTVHGLNKALNESSDPRLTIGILKCLFRLYHKDKPWDGKQWWSTRPDDRGPYYEPITWDQTASIAEGIERGFGMIPPENHSDLLVLLRKNRIDPAQLNLNVQVDEVLALIESKSPGSFAIEPLKEAALDAKRENEVRLEAFRALQRIVGNDSFIAQLAVLAGWHDNERENQSFQNETKSFVFSSEHQQKPKILRNLLKKPKGYEGRIGMMIALNIIQSPLSNQYMKDLLTSALDKHKRNPDYLYSIGDLKLSAFRPDVEAALKDEKPKVAKAASEVLSILDKVSVESSSASSQMIQFMDKEKAMKLVLETSGDATLGKQLFARQACVACHTISRDEPQKGPYLGDAGKKWKRADLIQSVLDPNAIVAQGFQTQWFETSDDLSYEGFVTAMEDGEIEVRNVAGIVSRFKQSDVVKQGTRTNSMMPEGLAANLTVHELASLIDFLQSLH